MNQSSISERAAITSKICQFLNSIGIPTKATSISEKTFLPGILIVQGSISFDPDKMAEPGDLLHEAGHIALMSTIERQRTSGNVMADKVDYNSAELGAILWSFAALKHLKLASEIVFHNNGYLAGSEWLINSLESGEYQGLPLLEWNRLTDAKTFPKMHHWVSQR